MFSCNYSSRAYLPEEFTDALLNSDSLPRMTSQGEGPLGALDSGVVDVEKIAGASDFRRFRITCRGRVLRVIAEGTDWGSGRR